ncbi:MAG: translation initiation factor IF-3 [Eubacteriales bacterium]|nr:translation initiation factor IF-3 [Eubacteriales bacterium]
MVNRQIRDKEVRVIGSNGEQLGIMPIAQALQEAEAAALDLVRVASNAKPPVCRLMDYDKHRYEQAKKEKEMRKNQQTISVKEVQLSATIEENDIQVKEKRARKFLSKGDKVKVTIRFRGRQITHPEIGVSVMKDFAERLNDVSTVEKKPGTEGRHMIMILAPASSDDKPVSKQR